MALSKVDDRGLNTPIDLLDNEKLRLGTGNDLEIYHSGSHSYIANDTNFLFIHSDSIALRSQSQETFIDCSLNGSVDLYYNNTKRFETTANGTLMPDLAEARFGTGGNDFGIYHDSTNTVNVINNRECPEFHIRHYSEKAIVTHGSGAVELYHNNNKKFETTNSGVSVTGGVYCNTDGGANGVQIGAGNDLILQHNGTNSFIDNNTGDLYIQTTGSGDDILIESADDFTVKVNGSETAIQATGDGAVELYHNNSKKIETYINGVQVTGNLYIPDGSTSGNYVGLGNAADLKIYHNGTDSVIRDDGTGNLNLQTVNSNVNVYVNTNELAASFITNGAVELYYDNSKKFETTSSGATVTGTVTATAFSGDGIIPAGGIIIWSGASNAIPTGWLLCNGSNSTPDLRDRFVVGAGSTYSVGATGGANSVTLTIAQMPNHSHPIQIRTGVDDNNFSFNNGFSSDSNTGGGTFNSNTEGGGGSHENRPPYYALCYIMKS